MICTIWYVKYCHLVSQFRFNSWNIFWSSYWSLHLFFHNIHIYLLLFVNVFYVHTFTFYSCVIKRGLGNPPKSWPMRCDKQARRLIISHRGHTCLGKSRAHFCSLGASATQETRQKSWCTNKNIWKEKISGLNAWWARQTDGQRVWATEWWILLCFGIGDTDMEHGQYSLTQMHTNSSEFIRSHNNTQTSTHSNIPTRGNEFPLLSLCVLFHLSNWCTSTHTHMLAGQWKCFATWLWSLAGLPGLSHAKQSQSSSLNISECVSWTWPFPLARNTES